MKKITPTRKSKGLIRSLNRKATKSDKSPPVVRKEATPAGLSVCSQCGAVYAKRTWRIGRTLSHEMLARSRWTTCPACKQVARGVGQGKLLLRGDTLAAQRELIEQRIRNVAERAARTQPERRVVTIDEQPGRLEVITTSQKLAHRMAHELKKLFGGKAAYSWQDDGTLLATFDMAKRPPRKAANRKR